MINLLNKVLHKKNGVFIIESYDERMLDEEQNKCNKEKNHRTKFNNKMRTKPYLLTIYLLVFSFSVFGQNKYNNLKKYSRSELVEDLSYLKKRLIKGHPGLYWYSSQNDFLKAINQIENSLNQSMTELEFLNQVAKLNATIKCAHSDIRPSHNYNKFWKDSVYLIPINIMKVNTDYIIHQNLTGYKELTVGTKLISINDVAIAEIIHQVLPYIPSDGDNQTRKYNALKRGFYRYYSYYVNSTSKNFKIRYENAQGKPAEIIVEGIKKAVFDEKRSALDKLQSDQSPVVSFEILDSLSTAILTLKSFRNDLMEKENIVFKDFITNCFKQLEQTKSKNLIIDVRGNAGGYSEYAAILFSFLTDTSFEYCKKQTVTTDKLIKGVEYDIPQTFANFPTAVVVENGQYVWKNHSVLGWRQPSEFNFSGNIYFLIDGGCSSTTSELASLARSENIGTFIGEEVGGCYMGNSGGVLGWFELPNSKLRVRMGMVKFEMVDRNVMNKQGVVPDFSVEYTIDDIIQGNDLEMKRALLKIKERSTKIHTRH